MFFICLPAIFWNIKYNFATYRYLSGPVVFKPYGGFSLRSLCEFVGSQIGMFTPFVWAIFIYAVFFSKKFVTTQIQPFINWLLFISIPVIMFFICFSTFAKVQENWAAAGYFGLIILSGGTIGKIFIQKVFWKKFYIISTYIFCFILTTLLIIQLIYPFIDFVTFGTDKIRGWRTLGKETSKIISKQKSNTFLLTNYYGVASELAFYTDKQHQVECINVGLPLRQYSLWSNLEKFKGQNAIYVKQEEGIEEKLYRMFEKIELECVIKIPLQKIKTGWFIKTFSIYQCYKLK